MVLGLLWTVCQRRPNRSAGSRVWLVSRVARRQLVHRGNPLPGGYATASAITLPDGRMYGRSQGSLYPDAESATAIRAIGTNALPQLISALEHPDSRVKVWICLGEIIGIELIETEATRDAALGLEEKPAETRRRHARYRKQQEAAPESGDRIKPSAKALDKAHRRPKWQGPRRPDGGTRPPDGRHDDRGKPPEGNTGGGA